LDDPTKKYFVEWWQARIRELGAELSSQLGNYEVSEQLAESAISTYARLHALDPELPWLVSDIAAGYRHLSDTLVLQNKLDQADAALVESIRNGRAADNTIARFHAGVSQFRRTQLLVTLGRNDEAAQAATAAVAEFEETAKRLPNELYCNYRLILLLTMSPLVEFRDPHRAVSLADQVTSDSGGLHWRCLAIAQYRAGDYHAAVDAAHAAMARLQGGDSIDWMILALALWQNGDRSEARRQFEKAVQSIEQHRPILFGDMGPLAIDHLREEAEMLMSDERGHVHLTLPMETNHETSSSMAAPRD
jgi:tetratricopeptide (TPR) repeat protein